MRRRERIAALLVALTVLGAFGTFQVPAIRVELPWQVAITIIAVLIGLVIVYSGSFGTASLPQHYESLADNRDRARRGVVVPQKTLHVIVRDGLEERRTAEFDWTLTITNGAATPLYEFRMPVVAEVALRPSHFRALAAVGNGVPLGRVRVDVGDPHSPSIIVPIPSPGLAPRASTTVRVHYSWPGVASFPDDTWVLDLLGLAVGGCCRLKLDYPAGQVSGRAELVHQFARVRWVTPLGALPVSPSEHGSRLTLEVRRTRRSHQLVYVHTEAKVATAGPPDKSDRVWRRGDEA